MVADDVISNFVLTGVCLLSECVLLGWHSELICESVIRKWGLDILWDSEENTINVEENKINVCQYWNHVFSFCGDAWQCCRYNNNSGIPINYVADTVLQIMLKEILHIKMYIMSSV